MVRPAGFAHLVVPLILPAGRTQANTPVHSGSTTPPLRKLSRARNATSHNGSTHRVLRIRPRGRKRKRDLHVKNG